MKKDIGILVIGSLNMDLVIETERNPYPGETIRSSNFFNFPGGKGNNQAVAIGRLGGHVHLVGCVGQDSYGMELIENAKTKGVNAENIVRIREAGTGIAVINVFQGQNTIILHAGANSHCTKEKLSFLEELIERSKILLMQLEIPVETVEWAAQLAKNYDTKVILNPAPAINLNEELLRNVDILIPNEIEAKLLSGYSPDDEVDESELVSLLVNKGVKNVVITLGEKGVIFNSVDEIISLDSYKVNAVDSTGAGDAFIGGFCTYLSKGESISSSVKYGNLVAALKVTRMGAQSALPNIEEVESFKRDMEMNIS